MMRKRWSLAGLLAWVIGVYSFLYIPILILIIFSFNSNPFGYSWHGFTTHWYTALFDSEEIWEAFFNSLIVAFVTVCITSILSILFVWYGMRGSLSRYVTMFYVNVGIPEIVLAIGLLSFFYFFAVPLGFSTLIASHTVLGLGYVIPIMYNRFHELDRRLIEASLDLGATHTQTFFSVIVPLLYPALLASALLVFIISFDDFLLSFFCAGAAVTTLPLYIFSMIRTGTSPVVSTLSTLLLLASSVIVLMIVWLQARKKGIAS